ncbi:MAG TPA: GntR family transcriptional regulator [Candidatus Dormibacteraeota bacterium]|jgi:DNA-binding GntR family transcriptional regulator|nr:GntR family transcriptional regulator [Candidatus Dormibacteraeota bacterium]
MTSRPGSTQRAVRQPRAPRQPRIAHPDLAELAYTRLAQAIATCEIPAGAELNEREVSERLGMSRTPLRAALHRLSLEGLVTTVPKRGTHVTALDPRDVADNTAIREALEIAMAHTVITWGVAVDAAAVDELLDAQRHAIARLDSPAFLRADEQFHLHLLAAAGNRRALEAAQRAWLHVDRARYTVPITVTHMRQALRGHADIVAALRERDPWRVAAAIRAHLDAPLRRQLAHLGTPLPLAQ